MAEIRTTNLQITRLMLYHRAMESFLRFCGILLLIIIKLWIPSKPFELGTIVASISVLCSH